MEERKTDPAWSNPPEKDRHAAIRYPVPRDNHRKFRIGAKPMSRMSEGNRTIAASFATIVAKRIVSELTDLMAITIGTGRLPAGQPDYVVN